MLRFNINKKLMVFTFIIFAFIALEFMSVFKQINSKVEGNIINQNLSETTTGEIYENIEVGQDFICNGDNLTSVELLITNFNKTTKGQITYGLKESDSQKIIKEATIDTITIKDNTYVKLKFSPIKDSNNKKYYMYIKSNNLDKGGAISVFRSKSDNYKDGCAFVNGTKSDADLVFKVNNSTSYPKSYTFVLFILFFVLIGVSFYVLKNITHNNIHKVFIFFALLFGLLFMFIIPPFQAPDEPVHFLKAADIGQGNLVSSIEGNKVGNRLPTNLYRFYEESETGRIAFKSNEKVNFFNMRKSFTIALDKGNKSFIDFRNTATYAPVGYVPQSIGTIFGFILNMPVFMVFYLGRLSNLVIWVIITSYAIKNIPRGKYILFVLSLMPMTLQQAASYSSDALIFSFSFLFISLCLKYRYGDDCISKKQIALLTILGLFITLAKIVYLPLMFISLVIPIKKYKNASQYYLGNTIIISTSIIISMVWLQYVNKKFGITATAFPGVDAGSQIKFALQNPIRYINILKNTLITNMNFYVESAIGRIGWLDTPLNGVIIYGFIGLLTSVSIFEQYGIKKLYEENNETKIRVIFAFQFITSFVLILSALYAGFTPVGDSTIIGVQGRYFIPILPLLLLSLPKMQVAFKEKHLSKYLYITINWLLIYSLIIVFKRYYIFF